MAGISSINTHPSIDTLVSQFLAPDRRPIQELEQTKLDLKKKESVFNDLKTKLKEFNDKVEEFITISVNNKLKAKKADISNSKYFTVETTDEAKNGVNSIFIQNLASYDIAVSNRLEKEDASVISPGSYQFSISIGSDEFTSISFNVEENDTNETVLNKIADAINNSGLKLNANIINDTTSSVRLSIKSEETGSKNAINLKNEGDNDILNILGFLDTNGERKEASGTNGGFVILNQDDLNAKIKVDGIDIVSQSNRIENVIKGVIINLHSSQQDGETPLRLTISTDVDTVKKEIKEFIDKYNEIINYITEKSKIDIESNKRGYLAGEPTYSQLKFKLRWLISGPVEGVKEGNPSLLSEIGIKMNKDGTLKISDDEKLTEAIENNNEAVSDLFNLENGIGNRVNNLLESFVRTGGIVDTSKKMISQRIDNIDKRIDSIEQHLRIKEEDLRRKFINLQKTLSMLNSQQAIISKSMFNYMTPYSSQGYFY